MIYVPKHLHSKYIAENLEALEKDFWRVKTEGTAQWNYYWNADCELFCFCGVNREKPAFSWNHS